MAAAPPRAHAAPGSATNITLTWQSMVTRVRAAASVPAGLCVSSVSVCRSGVLWGQSSLVASLGPQRSHGS
jgi:hypothetical protein